MYTELVFLLDKSSSMAHLWKETIDGFNRFLNEQKSLPGNAKFTLILFSTKSEMIYNSLNLQEVPEIDNKVYVPDGFSTAYLDAMGLAIDNVGIRLANTAKINRPAKVIFVTLTDGLENDSKTYSRQNILEKVTHQTDKYKWEFLFMGANMDAVEEGMSMGFASSNTMNFTADSAGVKSAYSITSKRISESRT